MYRNAYQRGLLTILFSGGADPLTIWEVHNRDGYISKFLDPEIRSMVLELGGTNVSTAYIICPKGKTVLGITMPFLIMTVKNLKKYFSFEVTILDDSGVRRRFRASNFQSTTQIMPLCTAMPICLADGWNQIQFNLAEFTRRAYKKQFVEVQRVKINANIRIRRIYFAEQLLPDDQLPTPYKLFFPIKTPVHHGKKVAAQVPPSPAAVEKKPSKTGSSHSVKAEEAKGVTPPAVVTPAEVQQGQTEAPPESKPETPAEGVVEVKAEPTEAAPSGPTEAPAEALAETPVEPAEAQREAPAEAPAEAPEEAPAEAAAEAAAEAPAEESSEAVAEPPAE